MTSHPRRFFLEPVAAKVPEITLMFWAVKLLTTAAGEAVSDYLGLGSVLVGGVVELGLLVIGLVWQFRVRRYTAASYWFLAYAIAVFGTGASDTLHIAVGLPYAATTVLWALVLAGVFAAWYRSEGTLSIHSILTTRREGFYWTTVFVTFALGTALGDFTATQLGLGYLSSVVLFAGAIAVPAIAWGLGLNAVTAFWWAYVLTRPLGASIADYVSKSHKISGLGFGDAHTALVATVAVALAIACLTLTRSGIQRPDSVSAASSSPSAQPAETP
jgi:uncharacterized membrane-anchored protein